jgi:hypothetical protein
MLQNWRPPEARPGRRNCLVAKQSANRVAILIYTPRISSLTTALGLSMFSFRGSGAVHVRTPNSLYRYTHTPCQSLRRRCRFYVDETVAVDGSCSCDLPPDTVRALSRILPILVSPSSSPMTSTKGMKNMPVDANRIGHNITRFAARFWATWYGLRSDLIHRPGHYQSHFPHWRLAQIAVYFCQHFLVA